MRILDVNNHEIQPESIDLEKGYLQDDHAFIAHHEAVEAVEEQGHYETVAEYPDTGGKDVEWVVDVPGVLAREAWDEYEDVLRYIEYTPEELAEREAAKQGAEQRQKRIDALIESGALKGDLLELYEALEMILEGDEE